MKTCMYCGREYPRARPRPWCMDKKCVEKGLLEYSESYAIVLVEKQGFAPVRDLSYMTNGRSSGK